MTVLLKTKGFKLIHRNAKKLAIQNRNTGLSYKHLGQSPATRSFNFLVLAVTGSRLQPNKKTTKGREV